VFESFELLGRFELTPPAVSPLGGGAAPRRRRELPSPNAVVRF
jgi:hypothetical protein